MDSRWRMERAGIVNFWFYDEAEFALSDGRLILRGANGSGKSVTMQSFLPLVLDGDKRPWRLDPFGSRDRRIEYYLLGDADSGITERTGYLYLEFFHPRQQRYLTIGIGLRARRNNPSTGFWGFAVTDNRRVGRDIFLYERDYSQGRESKIPLSRSGLEEVIGTGGWVVTEQGEYKRRVNKLLFGYEDLQSYQELLDLLIQLRSPKLSKDFKPSTIYDILTAALPALQEEDLRPLSEVLEDMDQINDRLNEIGIHRREVERLHRAYHSYNEFMLYQESVALLQEKRVREEHGQQVAKKAAEIQRLNREIEEKRAALTEAERERQRAQDELEVLAGHQALEKERELARLQDEERMIKEDLRKAEQRRLEWEQKRERAEQERIKYAERLAANRREQVEVIGDMEVAARECELVVHDVYHRQWEREIREGDGLWQAWRRDIDEQEGKLTEAFRLAREETNLRVRTEGAERDLDEARQLRDQREGEVRQAEGQCERAHQQVQNQVFAWRAALTHLLLGEPDLQRVLYLLTRFPEVDYQAIRGPVLECYQKLRDELAAETAYWDQQKKQHTETKAELHRQWLEWRNQKEPEPPRSEARERSRARRREAGEAGAPFYAVCEFRPEVPEEVRAGVESALQQAGLLDAWITPTGCAGLPGEEEEVWINPEPQIMAHTLAEYLYPTPPPDSGLTAAVIEDLLYTIQLGGGRDQAGAGNGGTGGYVSGKGSFCLGPLEGRAVLKERAEYIGKESRRQTRFREMARLEQLMGAEDEAIAGCAAKLRELQDRGERLQEEVQSFPSIEPLQQAYHQLAKHKLAFETAVAEEQRKNERFRELTGQLHGVRSQLHQYMAGWSIPKNERGLEAALHQLRSYRQSFSELKSLCASAEADRAALVRAEDNWQEAAEKVELETEELEQLRSRHRTVKNQMDTYARILQELGVYDLHRQMQELRDHIRRLGEHIKGLENGLNDHRIVLKGEEVRLEAMQSELAQIEERFRRAWEAWTREWNRRLVPQWAEQEIPVSDESAVTRLCQQLRQQYRARYEGKTATALKDRLFDEFYQTRQVLHDYVPETHGEPETDRILVLFMRDRQNPITPQRLLGELAAAEEEQRLLLSEKDRELYEQIIIHSVGKAIKQRIFRAEHWVKQMNQLMQARQTSSGLRLFLKWEPKAPTGERDLDTMELVKLLKTDPHLLRDDQIEKMISHFRSRITWAKQASEERDTLRHWVNQLLDYRQWFQFTLYYEKGEQARRELTDSRFNVLSGGEKAMAMYIPLFAATYSRYSDSRADSPRIISLDEAFAGVDEENMRDMFQLLTQMGFDYMMTSQLLWGCYDTVPSLSIYELYRPKDVNYVTLIRYQWDGVRRRMVDQEAG